MKRLALWFVAGWATGCAGIVAGVEAVRRYEDRLAR
jgi:hypothetical protein